MESGIRLVTVESGFVKDPESKPTLLISIIIDMQIFTNFFLHLFEWHSESLIFLL